MYIYIVEHYSDTDFEPQNKSNNLTEKEENFYSQNSSNSNLEVSHPLTKKDLINLRIFHKGEKLLRNLRTRKNLQKSKN